MMKMMMTDKLNVRWLLWLKGGMKVLVAGSWHDPDAEYSIMFDSVTVPATLVQHGLLRCYAPGR